MDSAQIYRDPGAALNDQKVVITGSMGREAMTAQHAALKNRYQLLPNHAYAVPGLKFTRPDDLAGRPSRHDGVDPDRRLPDFFRRGGLGLHPLTGVHRCAARLKGSR
jgi:hypothetical protein